MSSLFGIAANGASEFYTTKIDQSLRFNEGDTPYLERTFVTPSSTRKVIIATWIKPSELTDETPIIYSAPTSATTSYFLMGFAADGFINADDSFKIFTVEGNSAKIALKTTALFRDPTNWMHVCVAIDTTQATAADRVVIFFNGKRYTGTYTSYNTFPSQNHDFTVMNSAIKHRIGSYSNGLHANYGNLSGYLSEFYFVDGQSIFTDTSGTINSTFLADANTLDTFCEQKNGVAIPKTYSGTFGNNGCRLTFQATGTGTTSQGTTAQTNIGDDQSGEGHNFSVNGLASTDVVPDSPTNNFCTFNPLYRRYNSSNVFSEGNLRYDVDSSGVSDEGFGTIALHHPSGGKWYAECRVGAGLGGTVWIGVLRDVPKADGGLYTATVRANGYAYRSGNGNKTTTNNDGVSYGASYTSGDIIGVALNLDDDEITFYKNNVSQGVAFSSIQALNQGTVDANGHFIFGVSIGSAGDDVTYNWGQDSSFAGTETAQGNTDANGKGDFYYAPPTGYLAVCSSNLPDTTLSPNQSEQATDYFNTVLYTANNQTAQSITGVGFRPDWLWFKQRSRADAHALYNTSMGIDISMRITTDSEYDTTASATGVTALGSDGFTLGTDQQAWVNYGSDSMVAWLWKANGGTTSSNTDGTITSTVQASTDAGFSIVTYTGNGTAGATIGHGLGVKPAMIIIKRRTGTAQDWMVYHHKNTSAPATDYLSINRTLATTDTNVIWNDTEPDTSVITLGGHDSINQNTQSHVAYVFAEIEGYSKFGSYTGNGQTDGAFVYTGFRPAWVMVKRTNTTGSWVMSDNKRDSFNEVTSFLFADLSNAENTTSTIDFDYLSTGFKCKNANSNINTNGSTYIYMAFAEQPFKFSNAR